MTTETLIEITEKHRSQDGIFDASLRFGRGREFPLRIADPAGVSTEELFSWYYEDWLGFPFGHGDRRRSAEAALTDYGIALFQQTLGGDAMRFNYVTHRRQRFAGCRLVVSGSADFHRLHWEALRESPSDEPLAVKMPVERRATEMRDEFDVVPPRTSLNILVVPARPYGSRDVNYRTITRMLVAESWNADSPVRVDVVRPGSWAALDQHLSAVEQDPDRGPGWYQAVHFDLHGAVAPLDELRRRPDVRVPVSFDVRFADPAAEEAFLLFETGTDGPRRPDPGRRRRRDAGGLPHSHRGPELLSVRQESRL